MQRLGERRIAHAGAVNNLAVKKVAALLGIDEPAHGLEQRRLAGAVVAHEDDGVARVNGEIDVREDGALLVRKAKVAELHQGAVHGGGASGALWETTQAGGPGWEFMFLQNGLNVNVSDGVEHGRSSWAQFPEINEGEPMFQSYAERWTTYRLGPKPGVPFEGSRFDASRYDQFMKQQVPRWTTSNAMVQAAYDEYFGSLTDGCIILAHSQGSLFALESALRYPQNVRGIVLVEPSSTLDPTERDVSSLEGIPFLFVYGDFLDDAHKIDGYVWPGQFAYEGSMRRLHEHLSGVGGDSTWLELPRLGIRGNTHAMMLEDNSRQIADLICDWIKGHVR